MNALQIIEPEKLHGDVFTMIGKEWMLVTAEKDGRVNTMTASWGGMGILWNKKSLISLSVRNAIRRNLSMEVSD